MDTYNINGVAVEYDTFDTYNMELFISEVERSQNEASSLPKETMSYLKGMCELIRDFFDTLIGEGTSEKCFGTRNNVKVMIFAYGSFIHDVGEKMASIEDFVGTIPTFPTFGVPATPTNREQRRAEERARRRAEAAERVKLRKDNEG